MQSPIKSKSLLYALCLSLILGLTACQPPQEWDEAPESESQPSVEPPELTGIEIETRDDGLVYEVGSDTPFTGEVVMEDEYALDVHGKPDRRVRKPFTDGKLDGVQVRYFPSGNVVEERTFEMGVPRFSVGYYSNGQKKLEKPLNENNLGEGPYFRWHSNGQLQTEGAFNEHQRFHGEFKEYDEDGNLVGHYIWDNQTIAEIIFESPEQREHRLEHYGEVDGE